MRLGVFFQKSLKPSGRQRVKKLVHKCKLVNFFGAKSISEINDCNAAFTSKAFAKSRSFF